MGRPISHHLIPPSSPLPSIPAVRTRQPLGLHPLTCCISSSSRLTLLSSTASPLPAAAGGASGEGRGQYAGPGAARTYSASPSVCGGKYAATGAGYAGGGYWYPGGGDEYASAGGGAYWYTGGGGE